MDSLTHFRFEARFGEYLSYYSYLKCYIDTYNAMCEYIHEKNCNADKFSYPMFFMARHSIEIGLKCNIEYFSKISGLHFLTSNDTEAKPHERHSIKKLLEAFKEHTRIAIINLTSDNIEIPSDILEGFAQRLKKLETTLQLFIRLDDGSFAGRYPSSLKGNASFDKGETLNLWDLKLELNGAIEFLSVNIDVFSEYVDYRDYVNNFLLTELKGLGICLPEKP